MGLQISEMLTFPSEAAEAAGVRQIGRGLAQRGRILFAIGAHGRLFRVERAPMPPSVSKRGYVADALRNSAKSERHPERHSDKRVFPINMLKIGDSFAVHESEANALRCTIASYKTAYRTADYCPDFATLTHFGECRVWRVA
jgi:hypothetical protein